MLFCAYLIAIIDKREVWEELGYFPDWNNLGLQLGLSPDLLAMISTDKSTIHERVDAVLENWLRNNVINKAIKPTWAQLVAAVKPIDYALSEKIKENHPSLLLGELCIILLIVYIMQDEILVWLPMYKPHNSYSGCTMSQSTWL